MANNLNLALSVNSPAYLLQSSSGGTGNAFTLISGPSASIKTYSLPNANCSILTTNAAVTVPQGGTGLTSGIQGGILYFNSTTTMASSALLFSTGIVVGGGSLTAPSAASDFTYSGGLASITTANVAARWTIKTTSAASGNESSIFIDRGALATGYSQIHFLTAGTENWAVGTRATSSNYSWFYTPNSATVATMSPNGNLSAPSSTAFRASKSTVSLNATGNGTAFTVICNDKSTAPNYDQNGDFNTATGQFTAPITGKYQFGFYATLNGLVAQNTQYLYSLNVAGTLYLLAQGNGNTERSSSNQITRNFTIDVPLTAGQVVFPVIEVDGNATANINIGGGTPNNVVFWGHLIC